MPRTDPALWRVRDVLRDRRWETRLEPAHLDEIRTAVDVSARHGTPLDRLTPRTFPLPRLAPRLEALHQEVVHGRGFALLRGLDPDRVDREEIARAFLGLGAYLGTPVPQNAAGHLLGHVRDLGEDPADPAVRVYRTRGRQRFHVDSCDVVGLLCLSTGRSGGASYLCSSLAVVAELEARRPDLVAVLERPFPYDRKGEVPAGKGPWYPMPVVHRHQGRTSVFLARDFIESAQARFPDAPRLSPEQVEALDAVERLAESDEFRLAIDFEPGDVQLVHDHVLLHAREAYENGPGRVRHLLRLWLSAHDPRPLPPAFEERYGPLVAGAPRGGIRVPGQVLRVPLEAE